MNVASRENRLVPFSWFYHALNRDLVTAIERDSDPKSGHDYAARVASVVVHAAFIAETAINEIANWLGTHLTQPIAMPDKFDRLSIREKWRVVPRRCGATGFDESVPPWEDFEALVDLRNALAHAHAYPGAPERAVSLLEARGCAQPAMDWFESVMTRRTARWAQQTASAMPTALKDMLSAHVDLYNGGFSWVWDKARLG